MKKLKKKQSTKSTFLKLTQHPLQTEVIVPLPHLCHSVPRLSVAVRDTSAVNQYIGVIKLSQAQLLQQLTNWI